MQKKHIWIEKKQQKNHIHYLFLNWLFESVFILHVTLPRGVNIGWSHIVFCFTSPPLVGDKNQFPAEINKTSTMCRPGYG